MTTVKNARIYLGLSGGVDSAVSAALLKDAGAEVHCVFVKGWYPPGMPCTWAEDRRDAMRVAARLGLPFETLDGSSEYKESVIDYLLNEYAAGRTPNPDVMCNRDVKFGVLYRHAMAHGADYLATGHYVDGEKDQRYFLWAVPPDVWPKLTFPLAGKTKAEVRALAAHYRLPVAEKPDSQGVCFLGDISVDEFLRQTFHPKPGIALDEAGNTVGQHEGALLYTLGERVALLNASLQGPWYVLAKDMRANTLTVRATRDSASPQSEGISFAHPNWLRNPHTVETAQLRYRGPRIRGVVHGNIFKPSEPCPDARASGQSIVFYDHDERLVGGGILS